ncbi:MAG: S9 family peptidase [Bacteroidetes bacterium]|nr:MAG: S9 family peptidase [Bacteroidota bacterium]
MKRSSLLSLVIGLSLFMISCNNEGLEYPTTRKVEVVDDYFGTQVADPYRWLESDTASDVKKWVREQNRFTDKYLGAIPFRSDLLKRMQDLVNYDVESAPVYTGKYYLFFKRSGLANQSVLYVRDSLSGAERVLLDPNTFSTDGTVALGEISVSRDSKYLAYSLADGGTDWRTIRVLDMESGLKLEDALQWVKFSAIAWKGDGFFYSRYDAPVKGQELSGRNSFHKVCYHKLGTPQSEDKVVFMDAKHANRNYVAQVTEDEKYLFISESETTDGNSLYFKNLETNGAVVQLTVGFDYEYQVVGSQGDSIYLLTDLKAPKYRLVRIDMNRTDIGSWEEVIPEQKDVLSSCVVTKSQIVATHMVDASSRMAVYSLKGEKVRDVELGVLGTVSELHGDAKSDEVFYSYTSFIVPPTVYAYNAASGDQRMLFKPAVPFDFDAYTVEQVFYPSKDETMVPMFLVHRKGLEKNGKNPTLLYGYGGFNISLTPSFSATRLAWLEQGGVFAVANIRGGGEYGDRWHTSGTKLNKQNVFDDFIAAAEWLQAQDYCSPDYLAIQGGSNGGLLVGAVVNQEPGLFAVAVPQVGVMDMLRYQHFTIGWAWSSDYGTSDDRVSFENLYAYSPLHNIADGTNYPAILATTGDHDDRVVPAHSFKYIATLQERQPQGPPKLIRIETRGGHGAGKPLKLVLEEVADVYAFIFHSMDVQPKSVE